MDAVKFIIGFVMIAWLPILVIGLGLIYHSYNKVRRYRGDK